MARVYNCTTHDIYRMSICHSFNKGEVLEIQDENTPITLADCLAQQLVNRFLDENTDSNLTLVFRKEWYAGIGTLEELNKVFKIRNKRERVSIPLSEFYDVAHIAPRRKFATVGGL